jgi:hypothetical protein
MPTEAVPLSENFTARQKRFRVPLSARKKEE